MKTMLRCFAASLILVGSSHALDRIPQLPLIPSPSLEEQLKEDPKIQELLKEPTGNDLLHHMILTIDPDAKGQIGAWQFQANGTVLVCVTDQNADRMRIMTTVAPLEEVTEEQLAKCLEANFDRALDARYCTNHGAVWGAFVHPLSTLQISDFLSATHQVVALKKNFGTTYSSDAMIFRGGEEAQKQEELRGPTS